LLCPFAHRTSKCHSRQGGDGGKVTPARGVMPEAPGAREIAFLSDFIPQGAHLRAGPIDLAETCDLFPNERIAISAAGPRRRAEFAAGRRVARLAITGLGLGTFGIPSGEDRAPVWPPSIVGSISHCDGLALAIVSRRCDLSALGVDCETRVRVPPSLAHRILRPDEVRPAGLPSELEQDWLTVIFSAKEAVFKAVYPAIGRIIGFDKIKLEFDGAGRSFLSRRFDEDGEFVEDGPSGVVHIGSYHVFSVAWIPPLGSGAQCVVCRANRIPGFD
jgi:4'-phosphopantetheinyl transferase EntD